MSVIKFNRRYALAVEDYTISDVRMRFTCEYQLGGFVPLLEVELYNLNKNTVNELLVRDMKFSFSAGYKDDFPVIFQGQIRNVFTTRNDVDLITTILAGGSDQQLREVWVNKTLDNAKSLREVIEDYLFEADLPIGDIQIKETQINGSVSAADNFLNVMKDLAKAYGFNWYVFNGQFYAYDTTLYPNRGVYKISTATGLLEVPILTDLGINVRTLMEPSIRPQDRYEVESEGLALTQNATAFVAARENARGRQSVYEVRHFGDTHSNEWYTELKGLANVA